MIHYEETQEELTSFLAELVGKHLKPVLDQFLPLEQEEREEYPNPYVGEVLAQFLKEMEPEIGRIARRLYEKVFRAVPLEDLEQEGMYGVSVALQRYDARKVKGEGSFKGYCKKWAHGKMCRYLTRELQPSTKSLEVHLQGQNEKGMYGRELADTKRLEPCEPCEPCLGAKEKRQRVLLALEQLSVRERLVIMAAFGIEDHQGTCLAPDEVQDSLELNISTYRDILTGARKKLSQILYQ